MRDLRAQGLLSLRRITGGRLKLFQRFLSLSQLFADLTLCSFRFFDFALRLTQFGACVSEASIQGLLFFFGCVELTVRLLQLRLELVDLVVQFPGCLLDRGVAWRLSRNRARARGHDLGTWPRHWLVSTKRRAALWQRG